MKVKKLVGYFLVLFLVVSNMFNYSTFASYKTEFNIITETIMAEDKQDEYGQVTISHLDIDSGEKLLEDEVLSREVATEILGEAFKKDIKGYTFKGAVPEKLVVTEENNEFKLYYKKDEVVPEEKYVDVTVHHYLIDSTESVAEDEIFKQVKVGTLLTSKDYIKAIEKHDFVYASPETLKVSEEEKEISLFYKKIEDPEPVKFDVKVLYLDMEEKEIAESTIIKGVEAGTSVKGRDYIKTIEGYEFNYAFPEILQVREDNKVIKLYYKTQQVQPPVEYVNVTVNHFLMDTETKIAESEELNNIKIGEVLRCEQYKKDIEGHTFEKAEVETLEVSKDNNVVNLYYRKLEDEKPKPPSPDEGGKDESDLPQTGGIMDYLWVGYVLILLGICLKIYKKEELNN